MRTSIKLLTGALLLTVVSATGCKEATTDQPPAPENAMTPLRLSDVTDAQWQTLAERRIFFGHQSVGRNILAGMHLVLEDHPEIRLTIVGAENPASVEGPAFIEADIGQNYHPDTKADAFRGTLDQGFGSEPGAVAMYKYCYVDMGKDTDPEAMFADYVKRTDAIKELYPNLTIVHFTMPLRAADTGFKEWLKRRLGVTTELRLNAKRNRYNELLRERYGGREPLFDLAAVESIRSDGSPAFETYRGRNVMMLAPEWTEDGGHLTEQAQVRVAEQFLVFLSRLPAPQGRRSEADRHDATSVSG